MRNLVLTRINQKRQIQNHKIQINSNYPKQLGLCLKIGFFEFVIFLIFGKLLFVIFCQKKHEY